MSEATLQSPRLGKPARLLSDSALAEKAADGDTRAFEEMFRRYHQAIYRYCRSIVGNEHDAMDALQVTMSKAMRSMPRTGQAVKLKPWLYRVAHNECIDLIRRRREDCDVDEIDPDSGSSTEGEVATRQRLRQVVEDIGHLPERQRSALVMRELSGLGFEEIASALGTSASVSKQTVYEARVALQDLESGRSMLCEDVRQAISAGDGRVMRARALKAHLRSCSACTDFKQGIATREAQLHSLVPYLPAAAATSILSGITGIGGGAIGGGGGAAGLVGGSGAAATGTTAAATGGIGAGAKIVAVLAVSVSLAAGAVGLQQEGGEAAVDSATPAASRSPLRLVAPGPASRSDEGSQSSDGRSAGGRRDGTRGSRTGAGSPAAGSPAAGDDAAGGDQTASPVPATPGTAAGQSLPQIQKPPVGIPEAKIPSAVSDKLPPAVPKVVEKVQNTVDQVNKKVEKVVPPLPTDGLLGK